MTNRWNRKKRRRTHGGELGPCVRCGRAVEVCLTSRLCYDCTLLGSFGQVELSGGDLQLHLLARPGELEDLAELLRADGVELSATPISSENYEGTVGRVLRGYAEGEELTPELIARLVHEEGFAVADLLAFAEQGFRWNPRTRSMWLPPE